MFDTHTQSGPAKPDKRETKEARAAARRERMQAKEAARQERQQAKAERKRERDQAKEAARKQKHESKEAAREAREEARRAARDAKNTIRRESMNVVPSGFDPPGGDETEDEAQARAEEEERRRRADAKVLGLTDSKIPRDDGGGTASTSGPVRAAEEARAAEHARAARAAEESRAAEATRAAGQARAAEQARAADEARAAEQARAAEEARVAEQARAAEEARAASAAVPIAGMGESAVGRSAADDQEQSEATRVAPVVSAADDQEYGSDEYHEPAATDSGDFYETAGGSRKSPRSRSGLRPVASLAAGVVGILGLVASIVLAVGAFTVAIGAGDGNAIYDPISVVCNALAGPLKDAFSFSGPNAASREEFLGWGAGSILYLALSFAGQAAQRALSSD